MGAQPAAECARAVARHAHEAERVARARAVEPHRLAVVGGVLALVHDPDRGGQAIGDEVRAGVEARARPRGECGRVRPPRRPPRARRRRRRGRRARVRRRAPRSPRRGRGPVGRSRSRRHAGRRSTARSSAPLPGELVEGVERGPGRERDGGVERQRVDDPTRRTPVVERVAGRVHPVDRAHHRAQLADLEARCGGQPAERRRVEEVPVPREVVPAPVAPARDPVVERAGVVGDEQQASARSQPRAHGVEHRDRVGEVLDRLDEERGVVGRLGQVERLDPAPVHGQAPPPGRGDRPLVDVDAFEDPARGPELAEQLEVEPVATADVEDPGVRREAGERPEQATRLEPAPDRVHHPEVLLVERERVVVVRVDPTELVRHGTPVEVHHPAVHAAHGEEAVRRRAVLEVLADTDRLRVAGPADAAGRGLEDEGGGGPRRDGPLGTGGGAHRRIVRRAGRAGPGPLGPRRAEHGGRVAACPLASSVLDQRVDHRGAAHPGVAGPVGRRCALERGVRRGRAAQLLVRRGRERRRDRARGGRRCRAPRVARWTDVRPRPVGGRRLPPPTHPRNR